MIEVEALAKRQKGSIFTGEVAVYKNLDQTLPLVLPETLINQMDEACIEKSIIYAVDAPIIYSSNEYVYSLCTRYPERLIGFASVDPKSSNAPEILERAVRNFNLRGLKLHPPLQNFFPNDKRVFNLYEKALQLNIPVVFHVGTTPFGTACRLSQADPILIDEVANNFPDLRIMLTHLGTFWHHHAFMVVEKHENVYIDTSAYLYEIRQILTVDLIDRLGPDKIIFGTDYPSPFCNYVHRMKDFVDCLYSLGLPDDYLQKIFGQNVQSLLEGRKERPHLMTLEELTEKLSRLNETNKPSK